MSSLNPRPEDSDEYNYSGDVVAVDSLGNPVMGSGVMAARESTTGEMYNAPSRKFYVEERGRIILEKDDKTRTSQISDDVRDVKGGSSKEPVKWLGAGQRR